MVRLAHRNFYKEDVPRTISYAHDSYLSDQFSLSSFLFFTLIQINKSVKVFETSNHTALHRMIVIFLRTIVCHYHFICQCFGMCGMGSKCYGCPGFCFTQQKHVAFHQASHLENKFQKVRFNMQLLISFFVYFIEKYGVDQEMGQRQIQDLLPCPKRSH